MAWAISISTEGWQEIHDKLERWGRRRLVNAIADDKFEMVLDKSDQEHAERAAAAERKRLKIVPHDVLVDRAFELIEPMTPATTAAMATGWTERASTRSGWTDTD